MDTESCRHFFWKVFGSSTALALSFNAGAGGVDATDSPRPSRSSMPELVCEECDGSGGSKDTRSDWTCEGATDKEPSYAGALYAEPLLLRLLSSFSEALKSRSLSLASTLWDETIVSAPSTPIDIFPSSSENANGPRYSLSVNM